MRSFPDEKDRHVVAAAVKAGAQVIVTSNTRDFYDLFSDTESIAAFSSCAKTHFTPMDQSGAGFSHESSVAVSIPTMPSAVSAYCD
jgi:hypothetical protein